ncbi:hypothetical protein HUN39_11740 [Methylocystis sp. FS]|uniref:hypothetical protein n=1 Tax=Methylocystis silviterrae TaxID=2743612 RepID=UPI0015844853|nr:hypothetical protein [Methylocystis silviterrae]NUJ80686.1 hypothetical protein [Methylocystis silviterrae]
MQQGDKRYGVVLLHLSMKYELEDCGRDLAVIQKSIGRWCKRGMHGKRMVALLITTEESVQEIGERLRPVIGILDSVENFWIMAAPKPNDVFGQHGNLDPAVHRIGEAWVEAWERNKPHDMREAQRRNARFKQRH